MKARKWMRNKFLMTGLLALLLISLVATTMLDGSASASTPTPRLEGDVHPLGSGNGVIDSADPQLIAQHLVGTTVLTGNDYRAADVNDDDLLDSADLQLVAQYLLGTITAFPGGVYIP